MINLSMKKYNIEIKKNGVYAYAQKIKTKGFALVVLEITDDKIGGVRVGFSKVENFSMTRDAFCGDMDKEILLYIETAPSEVVGEFTTIYQNNLI